MAQTAVGLLGCCHFKIHTWWVSDTHPLFELNYVNLTLFLGAFVCVYPFSIVGYSQSTIQWAHEDSIHKWQCSSKWRPRLMLFSCIDNNVTSLKGTSPEPERILIFISET